MVKRIFLWAYFWLIITGIIACTPVERLSEDDIDIAKNKALIEEQALSRTFLPFPPEIPTPPLQRRELLSILHHPYSFADNRFLFALFERKQRQFSDTAYPHVAIEANDTDTHWPHAYKAELAEIDFLLAEQIAAYKKAQQEIVENLAQKEPTYPSKTAHLELASLDNSKMDKRLHVQSAQLSFYQLISMLADITETVIAIPVHHPAYDDEITTNITAPIGTILSQLASHHQLVILKPANTKDVLSLVAEEQFQTMQHEQFLAQQYAEFVNAENAELAAITQVLDALKQARKKLAALINSPSSPAENIAELIFSKPTPGLLNETFLGVQTLALQISEKQKGLTLSRTPATGRTFEVSEIYELADFFAEKLSAQNCIEKGHEIFVENVHLYHQDAQKIAEHLFDVMQREHPSEATLVTAKNEQPTETEQQENTQPKEQHPIPFQCDELLARDGFSVIAQPSRILLAGENHDVELAAQLIERLDTPRLQVLVEIFMVTVSRGFNRQLENILTTATDPGPGGNNIAEAELLRSISSAITGGYTVNLSTATAQIQSAFSFLETHNLGRVLSSPTILVQDGTDEARIRRQTTAEVLFSQNIFDNSSRVIDTEDINTQLEAPLELLLRDIRVFPAFQTVQMKVEITNKEFVFPLNMIARQEDADFTEDLIQTEFTASPGDVIVLAGLTNNKESTTTAGIPGTTNLPSGAAGLLGGSDIQNNQTHEMVVFMVPTVINPAGP